VQKRALLPVEPLHKRPKNIAAAQKGKQKAPRSLLRGAVGQKRKS